MIWLVRDFDLFSLILHALVLGSEAVLLGGAAFLFLIALPAGASPSGLRACRSCIGWAALSLAVVQLLSLAISAALLAASGVPAVAAFTSGPARTQVGAALLGLLLAAAARRVGKGRPAAFALSALMAAALLWTSAQLSHAASRMHERAWLLLLTILHHAATAIWIGALPALLLVLGRERSIPVAQYIVARFSRMAIAGAATLILAGAGLAYSYLGSLAGLYGTAYGAMLMAKIYLAAVLVGLGAANWILQRRIAGNPAPVLAHLRRFAEAEVGLGLTVILAAASLTAQPPPVDTPQAPLAAAQLAARFRPRWPNLSSPPLAALAAPTPLAVGLRQSEFTGSVAPSDANDRAWSEYNHHWAGLVVLAAGFFALLSRWSRLRWARYWPLCFAGLSVFILLRADPECWPLGPRPFWKSFAEPDVLEHRFAALLILAFAVFECGVQAGRLRARWASYVFPVACAAGAALLLTHSHGQEDAGQELLIDLSHIAIALLGATAGWARWLDLRLPQEGKARRAAAVVWPVALMLAGAVLLDYRES